MAFSGCQDFRQRLRSRLPGHTLCTAPQASVNNQLDEYSALSFRDSQTLAIVTALDITVMSRGLETGVWQIQSRTVVNGKGHVQAFVTWSVDILFACYNSSKTLFTLQPTDEGT